MKTFKKFLTEAVSPATQELKRFLNKHIKENGIKSIGSGRGDYHIRFAMKGGLPEFNAYFSGLGIKVSVSDIVVSDKYDGYVFTTTKDITDKIPAGTSLEWVNSEISQTSSGGQLFANKDLTPDNLGLAGQQLNKKDLIAHATNIINSKYEGEVAKQLISLLHFANTKSANVALSDINFEKKDLAKVSADFGEILSAIWAMNSLQFREVYFPTASNEKLIDFYGVRMGIRYPISVKSGGGGKVTIKNIIDAIKNRAKTASADHSKEKALQIFNIVSNFSAKEQMIVVHQYMKTKCIKDLAKIMKMSVDQITLDSVKRWADQYEMDELAKILNSWHKKYSMPGKKSFQGRDKKRLVLSPLGESIWKILNNDKDIKKSLTNVARQVTLIQVNVDVKAKKLAFKSNYFKEADFQFGWPGYSSGNKLGFKMKLKR